MYSLEEDPVVKGIILVGLVTAAVFATASLAMVDIQPRSEEINSSFFEFADFVHPR